MRVVIQRVLEASVQIEGKVFSSIGAGLLILCGFEAEDTQEDIDWMCQKVVNLRIFADSEGVMNESILDKGFEMLAVSQFTLHALTKKGNRPSYILAARPEQAIALYEATIKTFEYLLNKPIKTGLFGADMKVSLINDGPVTIWIDSKNKA
jgi:D-aminoacyl-tRNA deacylase